MSITIININYYNNVNKMKFVQRKKYYFKFQFLPKCGKIIRIAKLAKM